MGRRLDHALTRSALAARAGRQSPRPPQRGAAVIASPAGPFWLGCLDDGQLRSGWSSISPPPKGLREPPQPLIQAAESLLCGALATQPPDIPLPKGTAFERACWMEALQVPRGGTITYAALARRTGRPAAARAVGQAMRRNPLPLFIPCHRVVAASSLGGYAGERSGRSPALAVKRFLLEVEATPARPAPPPPRP